MQCKIVLHQEFGLHDWEAFEKGDFSMNVGLIAQTPKRTLLENFCIAYKGILKKHTIYATELTALRVEAVTSLPVVKLLPEDMGGCKQVESLIAREGNNCAGAENAVQSGHQVKAVGDQHDQKHSSLAA